MDTLAQEPDGVRAEPALQLKLVGVPLMMDARSRRRVGDVHPTFENAVDIGDIWVADVVDN